jgi:vacuolar protein sorting-associated protein VTA1
MIFFSTEVQRIIFPPFCHRNVVKAFYTSGMLFDVLTTFGELSEELIQNRKYAKWKAAYIHNCLKNGETPVPGPPQEEDGLDDGSVNEENNFQPGCSGFQGGYGEAAGRSGIG